MQKIGILGGTFNPVHYAHLFLGEEAREQFSLDKVIFLPNKIPPHRTSENLAEAEHRLNMLKLAVKSNPFFEVSTFELNQKESSYTYYTVKHFRNLYQSEASLYLILGADALLAYKWYKLKEITELVTGLIIGSRPAYDTTLVSEKLSHEGCLELTKIFFIPFLNSALSSTVIREKVYQNRSIKYLVTEEVEAYIRQYKLYQKNKGDEHAMG